MPTSDLQYYLTESTAISGNIPFNGKRDIDVLYVNTSFESDDHHQLTKNWTLALKCLEELTTNTKLRIAVVGVDLPKHLKGKV